VLNHKYNFAALSLVRSSSPGSLRSERVLDWSCHIVTFSVCVFGCCVGCSSACQKKKEDKATVWWRKD